MQGLRISFAGSELLARTSGALFWPERALLVVGDLHLGRSERMARQGYGLLPPYETTDTLNRLGAEITALNPRQVICLGDSFDDLAAAQNLTDETAEHIARLAAERRWIWVTGNHDPRPIELPGSCAVEITIGNIRFQHIAATTTPSEGTGEISAHYHPKARITRKGRRITRPCFLTGDRRIVLPAFGTYTGGLDACDQAFAPLFDGNAKALMLGQTITAVPLARLG